METYKLRITLLSDTTFGRGDGLAGLVDQEVEHDAQGFPFLRGRTLKGLLSEACDSVVMALANQKKDWNPSLLRLFGRAGSLDNDASLWFFSDATLPEDLRLAIAEQQRFDQQHNANGSRLTPAMILEALTTIRRQTAINAVSGIPDEGSLRAVRVVRRGLMFHSKLTTINANTDDLTILAVGALALRHLGSGRNRGRGHVQCDLLDTSGTAITAARLQAFKEATQ
ncbi:MAG: RAMP superfamily protein [Oscillochloris sp.]|nr:RAMP superfamily protein [Oscillochloris sp.]